MMMHELDFLVFFEQPLHTSGKGRRKVRSTALSFSRLQAVEFVLPLATFPGVLLPDARI